MDCGTMGSVRHVLGMRKSLISVGILDSVGTFVKGGVLKVEKGNKVVIKGQKIENLFKLIRSMVKVELRDSDSNSQVDKDGLCVYVCSQRKEM